MKIQTLSLRNFTVFDKAEFRFSPGINVLIGANATGKSHVLKAIYALGKGWQQLSPRSGNGAGAVPRESRKPIAMKLGAVFRPDDYDLSRLISSRDREAGAECQLETAEARIPLRIDPDGKPERELVWLQQKPDDNFLFVPAREVLSMSPGFLHSYTRRELPFDETYADLILALSGSPLKSPRLAWAKKVLATMELLLPGKVKLKGDRFYVGNLEADLLAEGLRKVAEIVQLLRNGSLHEESVLLWDEPEAGLNPRLLKVVADFLLALAGCGVQIVLATHDYLLSSELSVAAEYPPRDARRTQLKFFCLSRDRFEAPVTIESGETLADLEHNPILEEFAAHYDREQLLMYPEQGATR
jgi:energy-coupling factor transporter ATP-binding protein EcfA2